MKRFIKEFIGFFLFYFGISKYYHTFSAKHSQSFIALVYHQVADDSVFPNPYLEISGATRLSLFKKQVKFLIKHYKIISLEELLGHLESDEKLPENPVLLTFDDGYRNVYDLAFPLLKRYDLPAVIFCTGEELNGRHLWCDKLLELILKTRVPSFKDTNGYWNLTSLRDRIRFYHGLLSILKKATPNELHEEIIKISETLRVDHHNSSERYLTRDQIREMLQQNVSFGGHSMTHPLLGIMEDRHQLEWEIGRSVSLLEEVTSRKCLSFAYPFGDEKSYSKICKQILKEVGIKLAFTTMRGSNSPGCDYYRLRRFIVQRDSYYYLRLQLSGLLDGKRADQCSPRDGGCTMGWH